MNTGQKVSAGLHVGLILWVTLNDVFSAPDSTMMPRVTDVSIITAQEFAALSAPQAPERQTPERQPPEPVAPPPPPEPVVTAPIVAPPPVAPPPPVTPPAPPPAAPPPADRPQAAVIADTITPDAALRPVQRPAERVAPEAAPAPDPAATPGPRDQAAIAPDPSASRSDAPPAQEATSRPAAATETVTEATRISPDEPVRRTATAPEVSLRPQRRPVTQAAAAPAPTPEPAQPPPAPPQDALADAVADALAAALADAVAGALSQPEPAGLPQSELDRLRLAIQQCWNVGLLGTDAFEAVVTIAFDMSRDARPVPGSYRQVSAQGGTLAGQQSAYQAGVAAIEQCGTQGYGMPAELYDQWREVEITFNPARMSTR